MSKKNQKKSKKIANLYIYDYNASRGESFTNESVGFVAIDDETMTAILERFEGDCGNTSGNFQYFSRWTEDCHFYKWELKEVIELTKEQVEALGIDVDFLSISIKNIKKYKYDNPFEVEDFKDVYNDVFFNAKILVKGFEKFSNERLDALILAIKELKK
jgi:hypothetical protein